MSAKTENKIPTFNIQDHATYSVQSWDHYIQQQSKLKDAQYRLTPDEITAIDNVVQHVRRFPIVTPQIFNTPLNVGKGVKKHKYWKWGDVRPPRWTQDFTRGDAVSTGKIEYEKTLIGMDYDYTLTMPEVDIYTNPNRYQNFSETLEQGLMTELNSSLAMYREWACHRGSDIPDMADLGITGLVNDSGVTDPGALGQGGDDDLTTAGDVYDAATVLAAELIDADYLAPFTLMLTPKVYQQALKNKEGTPKVSDMELIRNFGLKETGAPIFDAVISDKYLIDDDETTTTGAMCAVKRSPDNFRIVESYTQGFYPMPSLDLGVSGKLLWMGGVEVQNGDAVVFADQLTTD